MLLLLLLQLLSWICVVVLWVSESVGCCSVWRHIGPRESESAVACFKLRYWLRFCLQLSSVCLSIAAQFIELNLFRCLNASLHSKRFFVFVLISNPNCINNCSHMHWCGSQYSPFTRTYCTSRAAILLWILLVRESAACTESRERREEGLWMPFDLTAGRARADSGMETTASTQILNTQKLCNLYFEKDLLLFSSNYINQIII